MHTAECKQQTIEQARRAWMTLWPHHCKRCEGRGQFVGTYDPSPSGVSLSSGYMADVELCESCTEKGICPRCGFQAWEGIEGLAYDIPELPCPSCGWNWEKGNGDSMPPIHECNCWKID